MKRILILSFVGILGIAASLPAAARSPKADLDEDDPWRIWGGVNISAPQKLSLNIGVVRVIEARDPDAGCCGGILMQIEPGLAGMKASLGYGSLRGGVAKSLRLSGLRTWGHPWGAEPNATYIGPEFSYGVILKANIGAMRGVSGKDDDWILTVGVGIGF